MSDEKRDAQGRVIHALRADDFIMQPPVSQTEEQRKFWLERHMREAGWEPIGSAPRDGFPFYARGADGATKRVRWMGAAIVVIDGSPPTEFTHWRRD